MGSAFCMSTPCTTVATGSPVKLSSYAGVPLHALVAYERAALDLPHDAEVLRRNAALHLQAALHTPLTETKDQVHLPFFSRATRRVSSDEALTPNAPRDSYYVDGVPVWLQEVAQLWNASSSEQRRCLCRSSGGAAAGSASSAVLRAEQQAAWVNGTTQQLHDFVSTHKFVTALQHARKLLKRRPQGAHSPPSSSLAGQLSSQPVFAELLRSYEALACAINGGPAASASTAVGTSITASMWCVLLCRFLRSLPEPLMPALCSRRLEPLLTQTVPRPIAEPQGKAPTLPSLSSAAQRTALRVTLDSFAAISAVDYVTFCFVLHLMYQHRTEVTGGEVEAVADAMVREAAVPHVVREVAHACKPEARMFWPTAQVNIDVTSAKAQQEVEYVLPTTTTAVQSSGEDDSKMGLRSGKALPRTGAAAPTAVRVQTRSEGTSVGRGGMALPSSEEESSSTSDDSSVASSTFTNNNNKKQLETPLEAEESTPKHSGAFAAPNGEVQNALIQQPVGNERPPPTKSSAAGGIMQWHDSSSSSSDSDEVDDADGVSGKVLKATKSTGNAAAVDTRTSRRLPAATADTVHAAMAATAGPSTSTAPSSVDKAHTAQHGTAASSSFSENNALLPKSQLPRSVNTTTITSTAVFADTPSMVGVSPVRKNEFSLLSRNERDGTITAEEEGGEGRDVRDTSIPSALFSRHDHSNTERVMREDEDGMPPSALVNQPEPMPLRASRNSSALHPSALEDPLAEEGAAEALRRALQMFREVPPAAAPTGVNASSRSPAPVGPSRERDETGAGQPSDVRSAPRPPGMLPSSPCTAGLLTPRDLLHHQQQQEEQRDAQQQRPPLSSTTSAALPPTGTARSATASSTPAAALTALTARPLLAALLDAKQRFLAAPVCPPFVLCNHQHGCSTVAVPPFAKEEGDEAFSVLTGQSGVPTGPPARDGSHSVAASAINNISHLAELPPRTDLLPQRGQVMEAATEVTAYKWTSARTSGAGAPSDLPPSNTSIPPEAQRTLPVGVVVNSNSSAGGDQRASVRSPYEVHRLSTSSTVASASASLLRLEHTTEFRKGSGRSTVLTEGNGKAREGNFDATRTSLLTCSPDADALTRNREDVDADAQGGLMRRRLSGSSLVTPDDTALTTTVNAATSLTSMERQLRGLRDVVRALESNQLVQARQAAAQTSELTARCAELQCQQREQEQQLRHAQSRLTAVRHELEDLKDDKARLQMQLTAARQEGAQLRDALLTGPSRI
ncbi:hypothetical protein ABB37_05340 [Leptomonas pyrrhocoris]|uniref:Uncharacterized protein n=1 Tax=Leptomonas pyrrhocoris TaxID=157538 RepID=A0A0M9G091_LEPPY|nr:hypothetical protein ABB37_05340 [Leptomonas pyrrhocoris]KPA79516.1 hypothetical protein ABB37_05340 [Leptomonas pyrrhocoris]|eukprot:XP_015657955.1 hypothetical protein ABB37_05340 [Leptomonas pyrrhocoris]